MQKKKSTLYFSFEKRSESTGSLTRDNYIILPPTLLISSSENNLTLHFKFKKKNNTEEWSDEELKTISDELVDVIAHAS